MESTRYSPCVELRELLLPAYAPCAHFGGACAGSARWQPEKGHVPRGFVGALGSVDEVELVLVAAEPGDPLPGESYEGSDPIDFLERCAEEAYRDFEGMANPFHRNIRSILDECFPGLDFLHQMRRTWITDAYLCSAPVEAGNVPAASWKTCARSYLLPQLRLLEDRAIVALGRKASNACEASTAPNSSMRVRRRRLVAIGPMCGSHGRRSRRICAGTIAPPGVASPPRCRGAADLRLSLGLRCRVPCHRAVTSECRFARIPVAPAAPREMPAGGPNQSSCCAASGACRHAGGRATRETEGRAGTAAFVEKEHYPPVLLAVVRLAAGETRGGVADRYQTREAPRRSALPHSRL